MQAGGDRGQKRSARRSIDAILALARSGCGQRGSRLIQGSDFREVDGVRDLGSPTPLARG